MKIYGYTDRLLEYIRMFSRNQDLSVCHVSLVCWVPRVFLVLLVRPSDILWVSRNNWTSQSNSHFPANTQLNKWLPKPQQKKYIILIGMSSICLIGIFCYGTCLRQGVSGNRGSRSLCQKSVCIKFTTRISRYLLLETSKGRVDSRVRGRGCNATWWVSCSYLEFSSSFWWPTPLSYSIYYSTQCAVQSTMLTALWVWSSSDRVHSGN